MCANSPMETNVAAEVGGPVLGSVSPGQSSRLETLVNGRQR